jgi:hypothetical protein
MRGFAWLGLAGLCTALASVAARSGAPAGSEHRAPLSQPRVQGQWIWTERDRQLYERKRERYPELAAAVLVGTLSCGARGLSTQRGLSPAFAGSRPHALVVRLSDDLNGCFDRLGTASTAQGLDRELGRLLAEVRATGARFRELELDYDSPESKLARWAESLRYLRAHALRDTEVWITSIPAHVTRPEYAELFRDVVTGHILQVFDTGLRCDARHATTLRSALQAAGLAFRVGLGTFERGGIERGGIERGEPASAHSCWLGLARAWQADPGASGFWIFPAGIDYERGLELVMGPR